VILCNTRALVVRLNFMLLVMSMVGVEDIGELADLVLGMDSFNMRITELGVLKLLLNLLYLLAKLMVEGVEDFLEAAVGAPRTGRRLISHV
jgi:hypothetical protein